MPTLTLRKATRQKTKMRVALTGPSGSGKTYSALLMASGMTSWDKIALIDTENGSGDLYAQLGPYSVITLSAPFTPERYIEAITACEAAGIEVLIIDSISHEWEGKGGILETHDAMTGNSYTNWGKLTPRHNAFIQKILQSRCHVVATMRSKQDYVLTDVKGKQVPQKVGLKAIAREGVDYEFTLVMDLNINHLATASKDRTGLFMSAQNDAVGSEKITPDTGRKLLEWTMVGVDAEIPAPVRAPRAPVPSVAAPQESPPAPEQSKIDPSAPALAADIVEIGRLAKETHTDHAKLFAHFRVEHGIPTQEQAAKMLVSLRSKLEKQLDELAKLNS